MAHDQVLRTGVLFKKGSGNGPFGRKNWKPRYFVLTPNKLKYYTYEDGDLKGEVDLTGCNEQSIEVMPADSMKTGTSASTIWRIAINANERRLLVAAGTEMEMNDWVEQILIAFRINSGQPLHDQPRRSSMSAAQGGAVTHVGANDVTRNSMTDFHNFANLRRSVGGHTRNSVGVHPGHEFRLSDEQLRQQQEELRRMEAQRHQAEREAEERREQELLLALQKQKEEEELRKKQKLQQEEQRRKEEEEVKAAELQEEEARRRHEELLESQRQLKREQHERERAAREKSLREHELRELAQRELDKREEERRHEAELLEHLDDLHVDDTHMSTASSTSSSTSSTAYNAPPAPARSPLIGDAKKEAMLRQQVTHERRREEMIKEQQNQMRKDYLEQRQRQQEDARASHAQHKPAAASPPKQRPIQQKRKDSYEF